MIPVYVQVRDLPVVDGKGNDLIAIEWDERQVSMYFRNEHDVDLLLTRLRDEGATLFADKDDLLKSACSSTSSGGCSGTCSISTMKCLGYRIKTKKGGEIKGCTCK